MLIVSHEIVIHHFCRLTPPLPQNNFPGNIMNIIWLFDLYGKLMQFIISTVPIPIKVLNHAKCLQCRPLQLCLKYYSCIPIINPPTKNQRNVHQLT